MKGILYFKKIVSSDGKWSTTSYDSLGMERHYRNSDNFECWKLHDQSGNEIYYSNNVGTEISRKFNEKGLLLSYTTIDKLTNWIIYDEHGREVQRRNAAGLFLKTTYSKGGREIIKTGADGFTSQRLLNRDGQETHNKDNQGNAYSKFYNQDGLEILHIEENGTKRVREYDKKGLLSREGTNDIFSEFEYDKFGRMIYKKDTLKEMDFSFEAWFEYDQFGNEKFYCDSEGTVRETVNTYLEDLIRQ